MRIITISRQFGSDCIIVGRDADVIVREYEPFRIYACADMEARLKRCMKFEESKPADARLSEKEILKNIKRIDRSRAATREILTGKHSHDSSMFDLTVNTTGWEIKALAGVPRSFPSAGSAAGG